MSKLSWDEYFMRHVYLAASKSKDPSTKIGAILVKDNRIIAEGFNGFPYKVKDLIERYNNKESKYNFVCHGEFNAILQCAYMGVSSKGTTLFTQGIVCNECCKSLIQGGIKELVVHKQWPNLIHNEKWVKSIKVSKIMMKEANIKVRFLDKVLNIYGFLDGKVISV